MEISMQCTYCFNEFKPKRKWQRFCSSNCRLANWAIKMGNKKNTNNLNCTDELYHIIHILRSRAHSKVQNAIRKGTIKKLDGSIKCTDCNEIATMYDHRDYRKPLEVSAVCQKCNSKRGNTEDIKLMKSEYWDKPTEVSNESIQTTPKG